MSVWRGGLWGRQKYPQGNGIWKGGIWRSQQQTDELRALIDSLFGSGQQGAMYVAHPELLGEQRLYQISDGTTAVDGSGDPVGFASDLSPNGNPLVQSVSAARATYITSDGQGVLRFDGNDDQLVHEFSTPLSQPYTQVVAALTRSAGDRIIAGAVDLNGQLFRLSDTNLLRMYSGADLSVGGVTLDQPFVAVGVHSGASSSVRGVGPAYDEAATGNAGSGALGGISLGARANDEFSNVDIYFALVIEGALEGELLEEVIDYAAQRAGFSR